MKKNKLTISIIALILIIVMAGFLAYGYYQRATYKLQRPIVTMEIEGYGTVKMELYPDMAPNTVKNFVKLVNEGYYNGLTFHRVEESLIQGGQKETDETSAEIQYSIKGEFSINGYKDNTLKFERGTVGLARQDYTYYSSLNSSLLEEGYNSGYAQFFIMTMTEESFDEYYAPFGKVIEGIEIVDTISKIQTITQVSQETGETTQTTEPINQPVITNMTVDTFGVNYEEPEVKEAFDINTWFMKYYYGM